MAWKNVHHQNYKLKKKKKRCNWGKTVFNGDSTIKKKKSPFKCLMAIFFETVTQVFLYYQLQHFLSSKI